MMQAAEFFDRLEFMEELLYIIFIKTESVEIVHVMNHSVPKWSPSIFAQVSQMG